MSPKLQFEDVCANLHSDLEVFVFKNVKQSLQLLLISLSVECNAPRHPHVVVELSIAILKWWGALIHHSCRLVLPEASFERNSENMTVHMASDPLCPKYPTP